MTVDKLDEQLRKTIEANLLAGFSPRETADALNMAPENVGEYVGHIIARWSEGVDAVPLDLQRLDLIINTLWEKVRKGDHRAIAQFLDVLNMRGELEKRLPRHAFADSHSPLGARQEALGRRQPASSESERQEKYGRSGSARVDYLPAWMTWELEQEMARITGHHARKRRSTVLRLAEGRAIGRSDVDTFKLPDTCTKSTWEGQYRRKGGEWVQRPGWKDDPDIQAALREASARAQAWQDQAEARRIAKRQENVAKARDKLAELAYPAVMSLGGIALAGSSEESRRKAANDILDRADEATASKAVTPGAANASHVTVFLPDNKRGDGPPTEGDDG